MARNTNNSDAIRRELEAIQRRGGGILAPAAVVEYARNENTALHNQFDWSDTDAAHKWRLHQARNIIRVVVTVMAGTDNDVRVFASLTQDRNSEGGYRAMVDVLKDRDLRALLLEDARRDMEVFQTKYRQLSELADVFDAMNRASKPKKLRRKRPGNKRQSVAV